MVKEVRCVVCFVVFVNKFMIIKLNEQIKQNKRIK